MDETIVFICRKLSGSYRTLGSYSKSKLLDDLHDIIEYFENNNQKVTVGMLQGSILTLNRVLSKICFFFFSAPSLLRTWFVKLSTDDGNVKNTDSHYSAKYLNAKITEIYFFISFTTFLVSHSKLLRFLFSTGSQCLRLRSNRRLVELHQIIIIL